MSSPHDVAATLLLQLSRAAGLRAAAEETYGSPARCYLDDDDPADDAPHVVATPEATEGSPSGDEFSVRLVASARDEDVSPVPVLPEDDAATPAETPGARFERFALAVLAAAKAATPGAILVSHSAEWDYAGLAPLRYVIFTLNYRDILAFGDQ